MNTEQEFIVLIRENSRLIYKVCSIYAAEKELIEDTFQDIVLNLWSEYSYGLNQLRKYLNWEYPIGFILVIILYVLAFGHTNLEKIIGSTFFCVIFLILIFRAYRSRIRNVSQSLRDLEEFDSKE